MFANSLDPDQARHNVGPDLVQSSLTLMIFLKEFFEKNNFEKKNLQRTKIMKNYPACNEFMSCYSLYIGVYMFVYVFVMKFLINKM